MARELTTAAQAAKMIRRNLRAQGLQVRVKSENFSMGNAVDVYLLDQTPQIRALVEQYCRNFQYGDFNGMEDIYEYTNRRNDIPQAKYVHVHNEMSDAMRAAIYQHCRTAWAGGDELPATYEDGRNVKFHGEWMDLFVLRQFTHADSTFWREFRKAAA